MDLFVKRLESILCGRDKYPWGRACGIGDGQINTMFKGTIPNSEAINAICRCENVSHAWLLEGRGTPYHVSKCTDDDECATMLDALFEEKGWTVFLVTDHARLAIVLTQPGQFSVKDRMVDYTIVEVLAGACGRKSLDMIKPLLGSNLVFITEIYPPAMTNLISGRIGTHGLLQSEPPLLHKNTIATEHHPVFQWPEADKPLKPDENVVLENYRSMTAETRASYKAIGSALAQQKSDQAAN